MSSSVKNGDICHLAWNKEVPKGPSCIYGIFYLIDPNSRYFMLCRACIGIEKGMSAVLRWDRCECEPCIVVGWSHESRLLIPISDITVLYKISTLFLSVPTWRAIFPAPAVLGLQVTQASSKREIIKVTYSWIIQRLSIQRYWIPNFRENNTASWNSGGRFEQEISSKYWCWFCIVVFKV